ncbi:fungal-specific transcription factor domain-containing protein [Lasiosphaeria hispida]|uniref:Fungal-specific transcription factor domain-containing protein n=1 Tax=Lasiosphaeria hispida TaxID=260671 RepID=A0AAJ0H7V7_9PEZI|nr:fungal-specific transcription factor domain-containing protein [Lasiosphaeria hispida]
MVRGDSGWSARSANSEEASNPESPSMPTPQDAGYDAQQIQALARHPPPGASVYSPSAIVSTALNPRSCVTCRRRKVRCDKQMPCSNCRRAQIPCIFPAPGRAPRRPRPKDPNAPSKQPSSERELELMKRLRKLEGIVEELSGQIEIEPTRHPSSAGNSPEAQAARESDDHAVGGRQSSAPSMAGSNHSPDSANAGLTAVKTRPGRTAPGQSSGFGPLRKTSDVHKQFGRLVLNEKGVTRYVSSGFWSTVNDELEEIRRETEDFTDDESDMSDLEASPQSADVEKSVIDHQSFILGYRSADVDLRSLHPLPSQIPFMWQVYQENVDPILKVLHVPTMNKVIRELRNNLDSLTPSTEALMFSIYYAAITSLDEDEVKLNFGADKDVLLQQYRFALEQALSRANFLTTPDLTVAQAFLLFLVLVRRHDDTRFSWTLTGLLIRISQALGLHRDGSHFPNISPFEVEMRRRLFWGVCVLDLRSAEDQGSELTIVDGTFDTQQPLNINDSDISPDTMELPIPREGPTDMTFSIIRYEICALSRRLHSVSSAMTRLCPGDSISTLEEREALLTDVHKRVESKYLKDGTDSNPMYWTAANIARLIVAKMTLVIYQPVLFPGPGNECLSPEKRSRLFDAAIEIFEYSHLLNTDSRAKPWRWLFQTYTQWHAVAYVLIEVAHRPWSPTVERAWAALNLVFSAPKTFEMEKMVDHTAVWLPLKKLYIKAKRHREAEISRLTADPQAAQKIEIEDRSKAPPATFGTLPGPARSEIALNGWRKLINAPPLPPNSLPRAEQSEPQMTSQPVVQRSNTGGGSVDSRIAASCDKPEVMDYINSTMASSSFTPTDFGPLWSRDHPASLGLRDTDLFGFSIPDITRTDNLMYNTTSMPDITQSSSATATVSGDTPGSRHHQQHYDQPQQQQQPTATSLKDDNHLPPWLWPDGGLTNVMRVPNLPVEEADVNMEEGFDWQTWQESLGRYELENGAAGEWGPGI